METSLTTLFTHFGLAAALGFLIGLEREMREEETVTLGIRDFVLFALLGAVSGYAAILYGNSWLILAGLGATVALVLSGYWAARDHGPGITTEAAAVLTFFLGVMILHGAVELAVALAILALGVLFTKAQIKGFRARVQVHEMRAVLLFLTITFIVLPVLPNQTLDRLFSFAVGTLDVQPEAPLAIVLAPGKQVSPGDRLDLIGRNGSYLGELAVEAVEPERALVAYAGDHAQSLAAGLEVRTGLGVDVIEVMLSALNPYKIWLIVVLVSLVSFVGYVLIKIIGSGAGIGLTGLVGGLVSSTVTTLSFARRSKESPAANKLFAAAVLLAGSIMFPRLLLEIAVVNQELMRNIAVPLVAMGAAGFVLAFWLFRRSRGTGVATEAVRFDNPFSLKSAVSFGLVFAAILMFTRLATSYLGSGWLPLVAVVSGLTDADAIAFAVSNLQRSGLVTLDWASFNLVLGALSNTFMKLFLVFGLGHRGLFRQLLLSFLAVGAVGVVTMLMYYDLGAALTAP